MDKTLFKYKLEENCLKTEAMVTNMDMDMGTGMDTSTDMIKKENPTLLKNKKVTEKTREQMFLPRYMEENQANMKFLLKKTMI